MNILFVNIPYTGHVNPTLGLAEELVRRGHQVTYILTEEWRDKIEKAGVNFIPYQNFEQIEAADDIAMICYSAAYNTALSSGCVYELLIYEAWFFLGEVLGEKLETPTVRLFTTFALNKNIVTSLIGESNNLRIFSDENIRRWHTEHLTRGINIKEDDCFNEMIYNIPDMNIVFTSKSFQAEAESFDQRYCFVGASVSRDETNSFLDTGINIKYPIIYISLGTIFNRQLEFYRACIREFANKHYTVIISVGTKYSAKSLGELPENIHAYQHVPQKEVLKKASLFITHGGMNSINEALYYGVPMVVIPQDADQPFNARHVKELELGECMQIVDIENNLYQTAEKIIKDKKIYKNIQNMSKQQKKSGGIMKAADLVENYCNIH